ncbi:MAG: Crp/Fnr family transcriptional regulator [Bacteroidetes bacterium]|nr:Crp/Fnr family transcriptional regulator [Bacteroidota bacterium]
MINSCEKCTAGWKNFKHLSKSELETVNSNRYEATFKPGEIMIKQGSPASNALFMATGIAKSYIEGNNGKNLILDLEKPGSIVLGPGAYVNSRHNYSVAAITSIQACFISADIIKQISRTNSAFAESLLEDFCRRAVRSHNRMVSMAHKRMSGRLADILLYLSNDIFGNDDFDMILTRQELGEMTSMAKECVVRIMKEMEDSGVISSETSRIKILDKGKLISLSEKG